MINLFKDIYNYFLLYFSKNKVGFFCENKNIYEYLKPYINNKSKKIKIDLILFHDINIENTNISRFIFRTSLIKQLAFLTLNLKYLYSSTPDFDKNIFKRSKTSKCKYIYLQHSMASMTMIYNDGAFNNFDAVQAVTNYQFEEIKEIKNINDLKLKPFKSSYLFLKYKTKNTKKRFYKKVLIAPSWNTDFYKLKCHIILNKFFTQYKISFDLRPHPMSLTKSEISLKELENLNIPYNLKYDLDFFDYDYLISDWSGIFIEFALATGKRPLLINTPKKILNKYYKIYTNPPAEIKLRKVLAEEFTINDIKNLTDTLLEKLRNDKINNSNNKIFELYNNNNFYFIFE